MQQCTAIGWDNSIIQGGKDRTYGWFAGLAAIMTISMLFQDLFQRGLAEGLGLEMAVVSSPTFTILHEHHGGRSGLRLVHADLYRLGDVEELEALGWDELRSDASTVLAVEWPEKVPEALPAQGLVVTLGHGSESTTRHARLRVSKSSPHLLAACSGKPCRSCGGVVMPGGTYEPFCSERCRLADLGNWFGGHYSISREIEEDDLIDPEIG